MHYIVYAAVGDAADAESEKLEIVVSCKFADSEMKLNLVFGAATSQMLSVV